MTQTKYDSDFEFFLRELLRDLPDDQPFGLVVWLNNENRVQFAVHAGDEEREFISFGNQLRPVIPDHAKPPAQVAGVQGFDAHKGMGDRS